MTMDTTSRRNWIAVASADHVGRGRAGGFMQVCHGKRGPLARIAAGDRIAYYSPVTHMQGGGRLQAFTAYGRAAAGQPYQVDMGEGFRPWRRNVDWYAGVAAPIQPLLAQLAFTAGTGSDGRRNWGYQLRFGLCAVSDADMDLIAQAMRIHSLFGMAG
ncbi:MAG: EVE domain-containing protein [Ferrovibrio sp.]